MADAAPAPRAFDAIFLDLDGTLVQGTGRVLPGARELVRTLAERGHRVALASLAGAEFVDAALATLGADLPVCETRCLASPGCDDKRAMLEDLCLTLGTRSALMVGDSFGDELAALEAGLPFVHFRGSGAGSLGPGRRELDRLEDLPALLEARPRRLGGLWEELGRPRALALVGAGGSGVDLLARDLARCAAELEGVAPELQPRWDERGAGPIPPPAVDGPGRIVHGAAAALGWPDGVRPRVVEVRAAPSLAARRLRAVFGPEGPQAVRAALEREAVERQVVARSAAARPPELWLDGGDVLGLGRPSVGVGPS